MSDVWTDMSDAWIEIRMLLWRHQVLNITATTNTLTGRPGPTPQPRRGIQAYLYNAEQSAKKKKVQKCHPRPWALRAPATAAGVREAQCTLVKGGCLGLLTTLSMQAVPACIAEAIVVEVQAFDGQGTERSAAAIGSGHWAPERAQ